MDKKQEIEMGQNADFKQLREDLVKSDFTYVNEPRLRVFVGEKEVVVTDVYVDRDGVFITSNNMPMRSHEEHMEENGLEEQNELVKPASFEPFYIKKIKII